MFYEITNIKKLRLFINLKTNPNGNFWAKKEDMSREKKDVC